MPKQVKLIAEEKTPAFSGISILSVWKPGHLARLMETGLDLRHAMRIAYRQGWLVEHSEVHNLVVTVGKGWMAQQLGNLQSVGVTYSAIGTGTNTPVIGDTQLQTEAAREPITLATAAVNVLTLDAYYPAITCAYNIQEAGWFAGPAASGTPNSGVLVSHYLQPYNNSSTPNDLTFEYILTFS